MAIYHFSGSVISKSQGRSAIACAAYRAGERLIDLHQDKTYDYTKKEGVLYKEIFLPQNCISALKDRQTLWNVVEFCEKRKDSQLAREFTISLPKELSLERNISLIKDFVQNNFVAQGMIADLCIHDGAHTKLNQDLGIDLSKSQPHAHLMLTLRDLNKDHGDLEALKQNFTKEALQKLASCFGKKNRSWNAKENLEIWREEWANYANRHLALAGLDLRIDNRSYKDQGIALEPQYKIGPKVASNKLARTLDHQRIAFENGNLIYLNPKIALDALTRQQSTFTHQDLARFINRHTLDDHQFQKVFAKVKNSPEILNLGKDDSNKERFTTKELLDLESTMIIKSEFLNQNSGHEVCNNHDLCKAFPLSIDQEAGFQHLTSPGDLKCLVGFAGTGKSFLLNAVRNTWEKEGYEVKGATLSGIASQNLTSSSGIKARTVASYLHSWDKELNKLSKKDILVIDEAGMLGSRQLARIVTEVSKAHAKLVLIGDPQQLQAIEAGAPFRAIANYCGYIELNDIKRQVLPWQRQASQELAFGKIEQALERYKLCHNLHSFDKPREALLKMVELWNDARLINTEDSQIMLAFTRTEVQALNELARNTRKNLKELGKDVAIITHEGKKTFATYDLIYFLKNDQTLGVKNGTLGEITAIYDQKLKIKINPILGKDPQSLTIDLNHYNYFTHGYAATIHKAQGMTVDRSYILASKFMDRHSTYTALTRHRQSCDIFYEKNSFKSYYNLVTTLQREHPKDLSIDYLKEFAKNRAFKELTLEVPNNHLEQAKFKEQQSQKQKILTQERELER